MFLKKRLIQNPFSELKIFDFIYNDGEDLKLGVISLVKLLMKDECIIKVFSKDEVNKKFTNYPKLKNANFNFYLLKNIDVLSQIDYNSLRFAELYITNRNGFDNDYVKNLQENANCVISFDNYLETTILSINPRNYSDKIFATYVQK